MSTSSRLAANSLLHTAVAPLTASRPLTVADHFRLPYVVAGTRSRAPVERLTHESGRALLWPTTGVGSPAAAEIEIAPGSSIPIFGRVVGDPVARLLLSQLGGEWTRMAPVISGGKEIAAIWRASDGSVFLPFDPDEICMSYWSERYLDLLPAGGRGLPQRLAMRAYYGVRGALPRSAQIWMRRRYSRVQVRTPFPRWPAETGLHDFMDLFLAILAGVAGGQLPYLAPWPDGRSWAFVLTHDVETSVGLRAMDPVLELERSLGFRSAWYFVPRRYEVSDERIRSLLTDGFEVGVHGLYHDGRDLSSLANIKKRLPHMQEAAKRWDAVGFRSPASHRHWNWMPMLGFSYDTSYPDTDPFEPQRGGCCSWVPIFNGEMLELPLTLPHDHNLFVILGHLDESAWVDKAELLRARGGMALMVTHPDYLIDARIMLPYARFLERYAEEESAWKALPREVDEWWRQRAASQIERVDGEWVVAGPAADRATIRFAEQLAWS